METLYHYCSVEAMFSIITNHSIWLSDAQTMNDHQENRWIDHMVAEELDALIPQIGIDKAKEHYQIFQKSKFNAFLFCLSKTPDLLSQWRGYAGDGHGVAIGINPEFLSTDTNSPRPSGTVGETLLTLKEVIYEIDKQREIIRSKFDWLRSFKYEPSTPDFYSTLSIALSNIGRISPICKNPGFKEEQEVRLIHMAIEHMSPDSRLLRYLATELKAQQRIQNGRIRTYFEIPLKKGFIREIWTGPKYQYELRDLYLLLSRYGYFDVPIKRSSVSYR